jgi:REP element-mobilizing transposase RayT
MVRLCSNFWPQNLLAFPSLPGQHEPAKPSPCGRTGILSMPQSLASVWVHLVFSTRHRRPFIRPEIERELHPYLATVFRSLDSHTLSINGTEDHVHVLFRLGRKISLAKLVEEVKTSSSKWIKTKGPEYKEFHWQNGYGAFSIGQSGVEALQKYIANQKEHHRRKTFEEEFRAFLGKYQIEYDERYVWD